MNGTRWNSIFLENGYLFCLYLYFSVHNWIYFFWHFLFSLSIFNECFHWACRNAFCVCLLNEAHIKGLWLFLNKAVISCLQVGIDFDALTCLIDFVLNLLSHLVGETGTFLLVSRTISGTFIALSFSSDSTGTPFSQEQLSLWLILARWETWCNNPVSHLFCARWGPEVCGGSSYSLFEDAVRLRLSGLSRLCLSVEMNQEQLSDFTSVTLHWPVFSCPLQSQ